MVQSAEEHRNCLGETKAKVVLFDDLVARACLYLSASMDSVQRQLQQHCGHVLIKCGWWLASHTSFQPIASNLKTFLPYEGIALSHRNVDYDYFYYYYFCLYS